MFFRNLTMFRFPSSINESLDTLDARLAERQLKPVGPLEFASHGFVPPLGRGAEALSHRVGECIWVTLGGEQRILPAAVVSQATAARVAEIEQREGRKLGGRARRRLHDDALHELLPRAFVRPVRTNAYLDLEHGFIAVDSASSKSAGDLVSELRRAMGSFPALPINGEVSARAVLTGWIAGQPMPDGLGLAAEAELRDPIDGGGRVRVTDLELRSDEIAKHLESGKQCTRLALTFDENLRFVIGEDLVVRKLKFLDGAVEQLENTERDSVEDELDARFALMSAELKRLFVLMDREFRLTHA